MPLHLLKLCVGCDSVQDLEDWIKQRLKEKKRKGEKPEHIHTTRMVPKRADELVDGGSLYWVIKGEIAAAIFVQNIKNLGRLLPVFACLGLLKHLASAAYHELMQCESRRIRHVNKSGAIDQRSRDRRFE